MLVFPSQFLPVLSYLRMWHDCLILHGVLQLQCLMYPGSVQVTSSIHSRTAWMSSPEASWYPPNSSPFFYPFPSTIHSLQSRHVMSWNINYVTLDLSNGFLLPSNKITSNTPCLQCRRPGFNLWVGKSSWRRKWQPTPVFLPGKSHGQRSLMSYSSWGRKESDTTEWLHFQFQCMFVQSIPTLYYPMDYSPPSSSVHGMFQARIQEWVAISFSRGSFWPKDQPKSLVSPKSAGIFFTNVPPGKRAFTCPQSDLSALVSPLPLKN